MEKRSYREWLLNWLSRHRPLCRQRIVRKKNNETHNILNETTHTFSVAHHQHNIQEDAQRPWRSPPFAYWATQTVWNTSHSSPNHKTALGTPKTHSNVLGLEKIIRLIFNDTPEGHTFDQQQQQLLHPHRIYRATGRLKRRSSEPLVWWWLWVDGLLFVGCG